MTNAQNESKSSIIQAASSIALSAIVIAIGLTIIGVGAGLGARAFCWVSGLC
jgi:hypothetical protein